MGRIHLFGGYKHGFGRERRIYFFGGYKDGFGREGRINLYGRYKDGFDRGGTLVGELPLFTLIEEDKLLLFVLDAVPKLEFLVMG